MSGKVDTDLTTCPVCELREQHYEEVTSDTCTIHCANCGRYRMIGTTPSTLYETLGGCKRTRATFSHAIRKMQRGGKMPEFHTGNIERILEAESLPRPAGQANILLLSLGDELQERGYGAVVEVEPETRRAEIGAIDRSGVEYVLQELEREGLIEKGNAVFGKPTPYRLTFAGWKRYEELRRTVKDSRKAFMAMKYGVDELDDFVKTHFKPAVQATGFDLERLDEEPKAGLIDARMEVAIRNARFVVADLTCGSHGVYWEAGFAAALDKPVIFTCRLDKEKDIHFDVNHYHVLKWNPEKPSEAEEDLKATIRATLPTEARMEDE